MSKKGENISKYKELRRFKALATKSIDYIHRTAKMVANSK